MELGVTPEAAYYIAERGGWLYLWQDAVGKDWAADRMSFDDPGRGVTFTAFCEGGVNVMLADGLEPPQTLRIRLDRFPRRLHIEWDGARWGWRGGADGGGG